MSANEERYDWDVRERALIFNGQHGHETESESDMKDIFLMRSRPALELAY